MNFNIGDVIYPLWTVIEIGVKIEPSQYTFLVVEKSGNCYDCIVLADRNENIVGTHLHLEYAWADREYRVYEI